MAALPFMPTPVRTIQLEMAGLRLAFSSEVRQFFLSVAGFIRLVALTLQDVDSWDGLTARPAPTVTQADFPSASTACSCSHTCPCR